MASAPYSTTGHLTVQRDVGNGTDMVEVWVLRSHWWTAENINGESGVPVSCYVAQDVNSMTKSGLPATDESIRQDVNWCDAPVPVRQQFREQIAALQELADSLPEKHELEELFE